MAETIDKNNTVKIKISGMSCNHCVQNISNALTQTSGVKMAKVDLNEEQAYIEFDPSVTNEEALLKVIEDSGYKGVLPGN